MPAPTTTTRVTRRPYEKPRRANPRRVRSVENSWYDPTRRTTCAASATCSGLSPVCSPPSPRWRQPSWPRSSCGREASPVVAVGGSVIDATPTWLKEFAIRQFGTNDKPVLIGSILVVLVAAVAGHRCARRAPAAVGLAGVAVLGLVGAAAAATRPAAEPLDPFPSLSVRWSARWR